MTAPLWFWLAVLAVGLLYVLVSIALAPCLGGVVRDRDRQVPIDPRAVQVDDELIEALRSGAETSSADDDVTRWMGELRDDARRRPLPTWPAIERVTGVEQ